MFLAYLSRRLKLSYCDQSVVVHCPSTFSLNDISSLTVLFVVFSLDSGKILYSDRFSHTDSYTKDGIITFMF